jgi:hypothetical protein
VIIMKAFVDPERPGHLMHLWIPAATALIVSLSPCFLALAAAAEVTVDKEKKAVIIEAKIAPRKLPNLDQIYPLEVVACFPAPKGEKAHETLVTIQALPSDVHKALEELGLKPGKVADVQNDKPSEGPELLVSLEFTTPDGVKKKMSVNQLMLDIKTGKPLPKSVRFRFTGSVVIQPDPTKPEKVYAADQSGTLIAIFPVTDKTMMQATLTMKEEKYVKLEADNKILPKEGTPVKLILEAGK